MQLSPSPLIPLPGGEGKQALLFSEGEGKQALFPWGSVAGRALRIVERGFDRVFGARANPWHHLGALGFYLFWIVVATGSYLHVFFDTGVEGA